MQIKKIPDEKAFEIVKRFFKVPKQYFCKTEKDLKKALEKINFPVYLKATGKEILHKTDIKGVLLANTKEEAIKAFKKLIKLKKCEKVLVQEKVEGVELIVGIKYDETFGNILLLGLGGIFTEIFKDFSIRICPVSKSDIEEMITELKGKKIFEGYRGVKINKSELLEALHRISNSSTIKNIKEMDINPLICNDKACYAVDVRILK